MSRKKLDIKDIFTMASAILILPHKDAKLKDVVYLVHNWQTTIVEMTNSQYTLSPDVAI